MTNAEFPNDEQMPKPEAQKMNQLASVICTSHSSFVILSSFGLTHSSFLS
jgi:hypothetical protein